jgi:hypothetical protein
MNNPETIIRGIMKEAAAKESAKIAQLVGRHIKRNNPTAAEANKHFTHDEKAAEQIVKLAQSMEEQIQQLDEIGDTPAGQAALKNYVRKRKTQIADNSESLGFSRGVDVTNNTLSDSERRSAAGDRVRSHDRIIDHLNGVDRALDRLRESKSAAWQRSEGKDPEGGLNKKGVESYRRENPGSKLQTAVTTEPSKLKPGSKKAKRRLSFCRRMKGMKAKLTSAKTARDPDSRINKSLRKWNCE